jgi:hypothetical protein
MRFKASPPVRFKAGPPVRSMAGLAMRVIAGPGLVTLTAGLSVSGCAPYVTHSPALTPGPSLGVTTGVTAIAHSCYEQYRHDSQGNLTRDTYTYCPEGDGGPAPLFLSAARTWKPESLGSGLRLGADVPPWPGWEALLFTQVGAFWQAPKAHTRALDWGAGTIVSAAWFAPYVQVGRIGPDRRGWYTTQMIGFAHPVFGADEDFGTGWHPTLAYQLPCPRCSRTEEAHVTVRVFVSGGIARSPVMDRRLTDARHTWTRMISAGITVEGQQLLDTLR